MTTRISLIAVVGLAMLLPCCQASAGFIIDDFAETSITLSDGGSPFVRPLDDGVAGTRTVTTLGILTGTLGGGGVTVVFSPLSPVYEVNFNYVFTTPIDLHSDGVSNPLIVPLLNLSSTGLTSVSVTYHNASIPVDLTFPTISTAVGNKFLDGKTLGNGAGASSVKSLDIKFTGASLAFFSGSGPLQAVPEPVSMALLGISSLGAFGLAFLRRRTADQKVA